MLTVPAYIFCVYVWKKHFWHNRIQLSKTEETHRYFITFQDIADKIRLQKARGIKVAFHNGRFLVHRRSRYIIPTKWNARKLTMHIYIYSVYKNNKQFFLLDMRYVRFFFFSFCTHDVIRISQFLRLFSILETLYFTTSSRSQLILKWLSRSKKNGNLRLDTTPPIIFSKASNSLSKMN